MKNAKLVASICIAISLKPQPVIAVEPTTVVAATSAVLSLFSKSEGDVSLDVLLANRELLKSLHSRLDLIEIGIAQTLTRVSHLPADMFEQNLNASSYNLGREIAAIGEKYIDKIESIEIDRKLFGEESDRFKSIKRESENFLKYNTDILSTASRNLMQRENSSNINALSVVAASYIELAMKINLFKNHNGSSGDVVVAARRYKNHFKKILNPNNMNSLINILDELRDSLFTDQALNKWRIITSKNEFLEPDLRSLEGIYRAECGRLPKEEKYMDTCHRTMRMSGGGMGEGGPGHVESYRCEKTRTVMRDAILSTVHFERVDADGGHPVLSFNLERVNLPHAAYNCKGIRASNDNIKTIERRVSKTASLIVQISNLVSYLFEIKDTVILSERRVKAISQGDFDEISVIDISEILSPDVDDVQLILNSVVRLEADRDSDVYRDTLSWQREEISDLISNQDLELQESFSRAADAAKWNRTLGYIRGAATIFKIYKELENEFENNEFDDFLISIEEIEKGISEDLDRSPDSIPLLKILVLLHKNLSAAGNLLNAKKQDEIREIARKRIQESLPDGTIEKYDVIYDGKQFKRFQKHKQRNFFFGTEMRIDTISIRGRKK